MSNNPTLLMTFAANNLQGVKAEADKIWKSVKKNTTIKSKKLTDATIDKLAETIIDCGKDLFMFHFGGHADQKGIVLDGFRNIDKIRLSRLLLPNEKHNVQLIFLNGCLSYGHVGILTAKGVKAIIATNVKVDDAEAVRIGAFFYKLFFEKEYTLKEAFETAEATVVGNNAYITIVNPGEVDENQPMNSSWTLFIHAQHKYVMDWKLADFLNGKDRNSVVEKRKGFLLYSIPSKMQIFKVHKCLIRISFDKEKLLKNLPQIIKEYEIKDNVLLSDNNRMEVTFEPNENFEIKALNDANQLIDKNDYTEWHFHVKPIVMGTHYLSFKVSAYFFDSEGKLRKQIILSEPVEVVINQVTQALSIENKIASFQFSSVSSTSGINQTHSGSGDNVVGNKIGNQINIGVGNTNNDKQASTQPSPKSMNFTEFIKDLVAKGKLTDALNEMATKSDEDQIIMLKSRINRLERDENGGTMDARDANIERNRITSAILSLLDDLT